MRNRLLVLAMAPVLFFGYRAAAQESRATLSGRVVDPTDAVVVGVKVEAHNTQTGVAASTVSNDSGKFVLPFLIPGNYRISAAATGFKSYTRNDIELRVNDSVEVTIKLEVGNMAEKVEVTAGAPQLETADSSVGSLINERQLAELPQRGGNPLELERLSPGAVNTTTIRIMKLSSPDGTSSLTVNGTGNQQTQYNLDGVSDTTNDRGRGYARVAFIPPSAAITDFKMESNPYDASVGHSLGAVINTGTKSGGNDIHGSLYYWARNSAFDSADFFANKAGLTKSVYQDHRFGASFGGPIVFPKLYDGHNKTFVFYSWEEDRFGQPSTSNQTSTVPTAAERTGDFSALLKLGSQYQVYNPFTTRSIAGGRFQRDPFTGNIIPKSLLSPVGLNIASIYPLPNQTGLVDGRNNFYFPDVRVQQYDSHLARIDHAFSSNHRLYLRINHFAYIIPKNLLGIPATDELFNQYNRGFALDDVVVLSPTLVLNFRLGATNAEFPEKRVTQGTDLSTLGFSSGLTKLLNPAISPVPRITISNFATLSNWSDGDGQNTAITWNAVGDLTKLMGKHTLKFGGDFRRFQTFATRSQTSIAPDMSFANTYTKGPLDNSTAAPLGQELAALLLGIPGGSMTSGPTLDYAMQNKYFGLYLHDDYKLLPKLTLNLGLRYELEFPLTERYNRLVAGFAANTASPIAAQAMANYAKNPIPELAPAAFAVNGGMLFAGQNGNSPFNTGKGVWLPRVGMAYELSPQTVIRGGYGIYYGTIGVDTFTAIQTGFSQSTPIQASLDNGVTYPATLANPLPNGLLPALGAKGGLSTNLGQAITFIDANLKQPYSQRWSIGVQRMLPGQLMIDVSYVGNRSTHLPVTQQINNTPAKYLSTSAARDANTINFLTQQFPSPFSGLNSVYSSQISRGTLLEPYPEFGQISVTRSMGYSWYHSLQLRSEKRFGKGASVQLNYTYSKFMQATEFLNPTDPSPYRVISDLDRPHVLSISGLWEVPVGHGRRYLSQGPKAVDFIAGGWQLQSTAVRQAGAPLGFGNAIFNGDLHNIPLPKDQRSVDDWFNVNAGFNKVSAQQLANNIITFPLRFAGVRADGQNTWNFSLIKNYKVRERVGVQFRAEVYNAMNHPSFDVPNTSPTNSSFGVITAVVSEPRNWQFALKLTY
jgi:hypothetical protein